MDNRPQQTAATESIVPNTRDLHLMLDLETLSTGRQSCVLSIGAVTFSRTAVVGTYYAVLKDVDAQYTLGAACEPSTALWWMKQSEQARQQFFNGHQVHTLHALKVIQDIMSNCSTIWGNGGDFDAPNLENLYRIFGLQPPWNYKAIRCFRTMKNEWPEVLLDEPTIKHSAIEDALAQARSLIRIWSYIDRLKSYASKLP